MNADGIIIRRVSIHHIVIDAKGLSRDTKTVRTVTNCPRESAAGRQAGRQADRHYSTLWNTETFATAYLARYA